jgi:hypothetical protein
VTKKTKPGRVARIERRAAERAAKRVEDQAKKAAQRAFKAGVDRAKRKQ